MQFTIPADHPCLAGHFPGHPLVPGVVIVEQVLALIASRSGLPLQPLSLPQVKFLQPLLPEQCARIELSGAMPQWSFTVSHAGQPIATGRVLQGG
jgi:3-hydroxyacyl-[acyl-carrier-protein] dehydratase